MEAALIPTSHRKLSEIIFMYRHRLKLNEDDTVFSLSSTFYTNYGPRSVRWSICFSGYTTIAVNATDSYSIPPHGKYKINIRAKSSTMNVVGKLPIGQLLLGELPKGQLSLGELPIANGAGQELLPELFCFCSVIEAEVSFQRNLLDVWETEFLAKISQIFDSSEFVGEFVELNYELRFDAKEFMYVLPWLFSTAFATPVIPCNLSREDYRIQMFEKANQEADFVIQTTNGCVQTVRYLLYLTIDRIRNEIDANPAMTTMTINHRKESVQQMLNYAMKGSFDLIDATPDVLDDFISCIRTFRPRGFWSLIHHITDVLRQKLNEQWETLSIGEIVQYLSLSTHHHLNELCAKAIVLIANLHYQTFIRDYNSESRGVQLQIYNTLHETELPFEGNAIQKIQSLYYAGKRTRTLLRFSSLNEQERIIFS